MTLEYDLPSPVPAPPGHRILSCLALSGGGARGLFTASVVEAFERAAGNVPARDRFDLLAGTSIGGIIAIGLATGIRAETLATAIREKAPGIFRRPLWRRGWLRSRYRKEPLRATIQSILGDAAALRMSDIDIPLVITAVEQSHGRTKLFRSRGLAGPEADGASVIDVALATSAAPTFFPAHHIDGTAYVDGGLTANAPDMVALGDAVAHLHADPGDVHILSVGTAGAVWRGTRIAFDGAFPWITRHRLVQLVLAAQENAAVEQAAKILGDRHLRVDKAPVEPIDLDDVRQFARIEELARGAVAVVAGDGRWLQFAGRRSRRLLGSPDRGGNPPNEYP